MNLVQRFVFSSQIKHLKQFDSKVKEICETEKINHNYGVFFNYGFNGFAPKYYGVLLTAPKFFLACSKSFEDLYWKMDKDFQEDLITYEEISEYRKKIKTNKSLQHIIKQITKDNLIF